MYSKQTPTSYNGFRRPYRDHATAGRSTAARPTQERTTQERPNVDCSTADCAPRDRRPSGYRAGERTSDDRRPSYRQPVRVPPNYSGHAVSEFSPEDYGYPTVGTESGAPVPRFDDLPRVSELGVPSRRPPTIESDFFPAEGTPAEGEMLTEGERFAEGEMLAEGERFAEDERFAEGERFAEDERPTKTEKPLEAETPAASAPGGDTVLPASAGVASHTPGLFDSTHFPFGHGLGYEELLLLGLILFLLRETPRDGQARGDLDETLILLGVLLLCG